MAYSQQSMGFVMSGQEPDTDGTVTLCGNMRATGHLRAVVQ